MSRALRPTKAHRKLRKAVSRLNYHCDETLKKVRAEYHESDEAYARGYHDGRIQTLAEISQELDQILIDDAYEIIQVNNDLTRTNEVEEVEHNEHQID